jgi:YD repeat-containing protein
MEDYTYPRCKQRVTSAGLALTLSYDANGNMTTRTVSGSS